MRAQERHHLKQNEFAESVGRLTVMARERRDRIVLIAVVAAVIVALISGYAFWTKRTRDQAGALYATAMAITESQIAPAPTVPGATQAAGTYPTVKARQEAALQAFQQVVEHYGKTPEGTAASYQIAGLLAAQGRLAEAEKAYQDVISRAGSSSIYGPVARMGLAETLVAEGQYDRAIKEYTDLSAQREGALPVDGVLMQLARTYMKAGKKSEARAAFKRVVDEYPDSNYVPEARQQMTALG